MKSPELDPYQEEALLKMKNGCILNGDTGSGKSRTSVAYFYTLFGGKVNSKSYIRMKNPCDLYIITTARKRDTKEWEKELHPFGLSADDYIYEGQCTVKVDSWENIKKYEKVTGAFFIFDEQRLIGNGVWVKTFYKIAKANKWILLTATPGDRWTDYIPVFVANGFYKNKTDFEQQHVIFSRFSRFPVVSRYIGQGKLNRYRRDILVVMKMPNRTTEQHHEYVSVNYDEERYNYISKKRWNLWTNKPIKNVSEYCQCLRRLVNSDISRQVAILEILEDHPKAIIFYNYDYELEILKDILKGMKVAEWNGHAHEPIPKTNSWVYLVQYTSGNEGWNCTETDTIIFYSQNYAYRVMKQAAGRIDRRDTTYTDLYYYHLISKAKIDIAILKALKSKKKFNESEYAKNFKEESND